MALLRIKILKTPSTFHSTIYYFTDKAKNYDYAIKLMFITDFLSASLENLSNIAKAEKSRFGS